MTVRVQYERHKRVVNRDEWVISTYNTPADITKHDNRTIARLRRAFYKGSRAKQKPVKVVDILTSMELGVTNHPR